MSRKHFCQGCSNAKNGVKSRRPVRHTCEKTNAELLNEHIGRNRIAMGVKYSDGGNYYNLASNSEQNPEHKDCNTAKLKK